MFDAPSSSFLCNFSSLDLKRVFLVPKLLTVDCVPNPNPGLARMNIFVDYRVYKSSDSVTLRGEDFYRVEKRTVLPIRVGLLLWPDPENWIHTTTGF